jgi:hypothetical protein
MLTTDKLDSSWQEPHFPFGNVIVPPGRVRTRWNKTDYQLGFAMRNALPCLAQPISDGPAIRWITPAATDPLLLQTVLLAREETSTFGILARRTHIQIELAKLLAELGE